MEKQICVFPSKSFLLSAHPEYLMSALSAACCGVSELIYLPKASLYGKIPRGLPRGAFNIHVKQFRLSKIVNCDCLLAQDD